MKLYEWAKKTVQLGGIREIRYVLQKFFEIDEEPIKSERNVISVLIRQEEEYTKNKIIGAVVDENARKEFSQLKKNVLELIELLEDKTSFEYKEELPDLDKELNFQEIKSVNTPNSLPISKKGYNQRLIFGVVGGVLVGILLGMVISSIIWPVGKNGHADKSASVKGKKEGMDNANSLKDSPKDNYTDPEQKPDVELEGKEEGKIDEFGKNHQPENSSNEVRKQNGQGSGTSSQDEGVSSNSSGLDGVSEVNKDGPVDSKNETIERREPRENERVLSVSLPCPVKSVKLRMNDGETSSFFSKNDTLYKVFIPRNKINEYIDIIIELNSGEKIEDNSTLGKASRLDLSLETKNMLKGICD
ncbi:MAG: hypothetical protein MRZ79_04680 [Bacteroidia bacterium]|nr:hypothetical protein [Bacteroidia bacterium]